MKRFIESEARTQSTLLPASLDEYVDENNSVRVIEAFVDALDLGELGFNGVVPKVTGRPSYHPSVLLKIYIYGYLNRITSSRRLERETQRNIEIIWPDRQVDAGFQNDRKFPQGEHQGLAPGSAAKFVVMCRNLDLFTNVLVAIDSSKFQSREQPRSELRGREDEAAFGADREKHRSLYGHDGYGRPPGA